MPASVPEGEKQFIVEQLGNLTLYYFNPIIARLKEQYDRVRPMFLNDSIKMVIEAPKYAAYPSGHATITRLHAHLLSHFYPESSQDFFELANNIAVNREYAGYDSHTNSNEQPSLSLSLFVFPRARSVGPILFPVPSSICSATLSHHVLTTQYSSPQYRHRHVIGYISFLIQRKVFDWQTISTNRDSRLTSSHCTLRGWHRSLLAESMLEFASTALSTLYEGSMNNIVTTDMYFRYRRERRRRTKRVTARLRGQPTGDEDERGWEREGSE